MTPERLREIRDRAFTVTPLEQNIGFSGLSMGEAVELLKTAEASIRHKAAAEDLLNGLRIAERDLRACAAPLGRAAADDARDCVESNLKRLADIREAPR